jgi:hypothetical protein
MLISGPTNLGMLQAILRKISTFEIIDGSIMKKDVWGFDVKEKDIEHSQLEAGIESRMAMFTFGLPLYILAIAIILAIFLPPINFIVLRNQNVVTDD